MRVKDRDEMKMMQLIGVLGLREGLIIQHAFMHENDDTGEQIMEWCIGSW